MSDLEAFRLGIPVDFKTSRRPVRIRLPAIPASFFGIVLGLGGITGEWRTAQSALEAPAAVTASLFVITFIAWVVITLLYAWKWIATPGLALCEARHPVKCCFVGLGGVAALVVSQGLMDFSQNAGLALFTLGAIFTLGFGIWRTGLLVRGSRNPASTTPVLYLPLVAGGFVTAASAASFGWSEWATFVLGAAFFSWLALESVVLHRLYTAETLIPELRPTLGIELAPPAVGALACLAVGGEQLTFLGELMLGYALFKGLLLVRIWHWIAEQPFTASYWGLTFGLTALPNALLRLSMKLPSHSFAGLGLALFVVSNLIVSVIAVRSLSLGARSLWSA